MPFRSQLLFCLRQLLIPIPLWCCFTDGQWRADKDLNWFGYVYRQMQHTPVIIFFLNAAIGVARWHTKWFNRNPPKSRYCNVTSRSAQERDIVNYAFVYAIKSMKAGLNNHIIKGLFLFSYHHPEKIPPFSLWNKKYELVNAAGWSYSFTINWKHYLSRSSYFICNSRTPWRPAHPSALPLPVGGLNVTPTSFWKVRRTTGQKREVKTHIKFPIGTASCQQNNYAIIYLIHQVHRTESQFFSC